MIVIVYLLLLPVVMSALWTTLKRGRGTSTRLINKIWDKIDEKLK